MKYGKEGTVEMKEWGEKDMLERKEKKKKAKKERKKERMISSSSDTTCVHVPKYVWSYVLSKVLWLHVCVTVHKWWRDAYKMALMYECVSLINEKVCGSMIGQVKPKKKKKEVDWMKSSIYIYIYIYIYIL